MKTTVEINDNLLLETKKLARERGTTFKELLESALRAFLTSQQQKQDQYRFRSHTFKGKGIQEGICEGDWQHIRALIYQGRGG